MNSNYPVSIIVPAYNSQETIKECLTNICEEAKNFESDIIVVDDNSSDKTTEIVGKFESIKLIKLTKNLGVGNARNIGAQNARYDTLCYIDSDLIISNNSIINLVKKLNENKNIGSVSAIQETINLNTKSWSSNFVCLKSCYGFEHVEKETESTTCASEFCVISKTFLNRIGGWKLYRNAGGEEFDLGYEINQANKKNLRIKDASYRTFYVSLRKRFLRIIDRTEKYIHIFLRKKNFESTGSFATLNQSFSAFLTLLILISIPLCLFFNKGSLILILAVLFIIQTIIEFQFLIFAKKKHGFSMLFFSFYGIQIINIGILLGTLYFVCRKIKLIK